MSTVTDYYPRGKIVYYGSNSEVCTSGILIPGTALLPKGFLAVMYGLGLVYLFLGISIISDIFMAGIENITSQKVTVTFKDSDGESIEKSVLLWNPTVANLTLMALGSSAPEILLALLETASKLDQCPGQLGAATIVGSASFNLLVISGLSIYAVSEENDNDPDRDTEVDKGVKRIYDMGVFGVTSVTSVFAYIWMFICLRDQNVQVWEAWVTFGMFFVFIGAAFAADRVKASQEKKKELMEGNDMENMGIKAADFTAIELYRELIKDKQGEKAANAEESKKRESMKSYLKLNMKTDQIDKVDFGDLKKMIEGEGMIKRIQYRKSVQKSLTGKKPAVAKG